MKAIINYILNSPENFGYGLLAGLCVLKLVIFLLAGYSQDSLVNLFYYSHFDRQSREESKWLMTVQNLLSILILLILAIFLLVNAFVYQAED